MFSVRPGDVIAGKYRVERVLGSGGMGYVVAARHLQLDQLVAMKFLRKPVTNANAQPSSDESIATGRFMREAKAVARLRDEHVAKVFDVGSLESGEPYIVMEYLDGCDLSALSKHRGPLPVAEAVDYVLQACEALAEAHSLGIVHRDVKLANLFVTQGHAGSPLVKVLDFGISKVNPFAEAEHEMTRTASMLGSPRFMSPEQMRDPRAVDARSDIWSLGVVLYRLVAVKAPFEAETLGQLLSMVMHEAPVPVTAVRSDLPPDFAAIIMRCLEKDPNQRCSNVAELAQSLVPFAAELHRAQGIADRIAQTLSVAQALRSSQTSGAHVLLQTGPQRAAAAAVAAAAAAAEKPGAAGDSGTAASWAGTLGSGRFREASRATILWASVAIAAVSFAGVVWHKTQSERALAPAESARVQQAGSEAALAQGAAATAESAVPLAVVSASAPAVTTPRPAVAVAPPPSAITTAAPRAVAAPAEVTPRKSTAGFPSRKPSRATSVTTMPVMATPAVTTATTTREGIPTTRD